MDYLFEAGPSVPEHADRAREREVCPVCGAMGYVERFPCGRLMTAHGSELKPFVGKTTGKELLISCARICHGFIHV